MWPDLIYIDPFMKCKDLVEPICVWLTQKEKMAQMSCMIFIKPDVISLLSVITQGYPKKYNLKFLRYDNSKIKLSFCRESWI